MSEAFSLERLAKFYIGIDPGQSGAIAIINESSDVIELEDYPGDEISCAKLISNIMVDLNLEAKTVTLKAAIEKVHAMPKQGVTSMFKFGTNFGIWRGMIAMAGIPFILVPPRTWQKGVINKAQDKKPALAAAARMFPEAELYGPRGGGKDGRADALLIADYCRRYFSQTHQSPKLKIVRKRRTQSD